MNKISILTASEVSWEDYKNLRLRALKEEPQAFAASYEDEKDTSDEEWKKRLERYKEEKGNWMIFAKEGEKLIGMAGAFSPDDDKATACIIAVFVKKEARGKGISKMLMQALSDELTKSESITKVKLSVNVKQQAAVNLYKGFGFQIISQDTARLGDGKYYEEYIMEREI